MTLLRSWVQSANSADGDFPLNNLPCGVFSDAANARKRCCTALGDVVIDLAAMERDGLLGEERDLFCQPSWNTFMAEGPTAWAAWRLRMQSLFSEGSPDADRLSRYQVQRDAITLHMPFEVSEFSDFYSSYHHAMNVGSLFRGADNALMPNWLHVPIGYNGRASSVVLSGTDIRRPMGQIKPQGSDVPVFAPTRRLDMEVELGAVIGTPSSGRVDIGQAEEMIFGFVLLNDWSSRDIQAWEYQPLGPFQSKATASSIGAWIVMKEALEPFRRQPPERVAPLLDYLSSHESWVYDIRLRTSLTPPDGDPTLVSDTNYQTMYYTFAQQLCHHTTSGCPMRTGDLLGSGTISGADRDSLGSFLEITRGGNEPLRLQGGQVRTFIEDGDLVSIQGYAEAENYRIGFGICEGRICPANPDAV